MQVGRMVTVLMMSGGEDRTLIMVMTRDKDGWRRRGKT